MKTKLVITANGRDRLEIICPDGVMARTFLDRVVDAGAPRTRELVREITIMAPAQEVLDAFNERDDSIGRRLKDEADIKLVHTPDPGSVAGSYWERT